MLSLEEFELSLKIQGYKSYQRYSKCVKNVMQQYGITLQQLNSGIDQIIYDYRYGCYQAMDISHHTVSCALKKYKELAADEYKINMTFQIKCLDTLGPKQKDALHSLMDCCNEIAGYGTTANYAPANTGCCNFVINTTNTFNLLILINNLIGLARDKRDITVERNERNKWWFNAVLVFLQSIIATPAFQDISIKLGKGSFVLTMEEIGRMIEAINSFL